MKIIREYTCAFTGHRILGKDFDREKLTNAIKVLIKNDITTFLVGMAVGFDTECFHILEKLREENEISIIACVPCKNQDERFSLAQKKEYRRMLSVADEVITLEETYTPYCMIKRNRFMVDNCCILISYLREENGGTKYTVDYAKKQNIPVCNL